MTNTELDLDIDADAAIADRLPAGTYDAAGNVVDLESRPSVRPKPRDVVVCSFHTPDEYYAGHARELRDRLEYLGLRHELLQVDPPGDEDWADVTRRKIGFIRDVCLRNPAAMVIWIDVDCRLTALPEYVRNSTADFIGFQRSFRSPLHIGYHNRTRFWEPSFWGVNATAMGRKLIEDAHALEQRSTLKATDDYFLEEAWRANARNLTFQIIPSTAIVKRRTVVEREAPTPFFVFGSSGNVAQFKDKVVQHTGRASSASPRTKALARAKRIERALPEGARRPLRRLADTVGVTGILTTDSSAGLDPNRAHDLDVLLSAGMTGDAPAFALAAADFDNRYVPAAGEKVTREVASAFLDYSARGSEETIRLAWWSKPFPGNFGDWLSPLVVAAHTDASIRLHPVTRTTKQPHLFGLGSIGRFIRPSSVVCGTGISRADVELARRAQYVSVRGPITAHVVHQSGGPTVERFGDPGVLVSRIIPIERDQTNGRVALVRHFSHLDAPVRVPEHVDEIGILMSRRADIERFLHRLARYDAVITSSLHVMIVCQSYGIPCGLVTFEGFEGTVHGTGIKYEDYALGADVPVLTPQLIGLDLRGRDLGNLIHDIRISEATKDVVEASTRDGLALLAGRRGRA